MMNELGKNELQVALNKVCFSTDFKMFFSTRHHLCPRGMTIGVEGDPKGETEQAKKCFYLALVIREYGYDSSSNRGTSIYDDLQDSIQAATTLLENIWKRCSNTSKPVNLNCTRNIWMV